MDAVNAMRVETFTGFPLLISNGWTKYPSVGVSARNLPIGCGKTEMSLPARRASVAQRSVRP
jgi:hypothetical protein